MENELEYMITTYKKAPQIYQPSSFWQNLNNIHLQQLEETGYANFKKTLNLRYFNFMYQYKDNVFRRLAELNPQIQFATPQSKQEIYELFVKLLWEYTKSIDKESLLEKIKEPLEGNPFRIYYKEQLISQDICNSIIEYYSIMNEVHTKSRLSVAELGAGYGRDAFVFLKALKCKYSIFDIPPALYISQRYLNSVFPELKIFNFRDFSSYAEIESEYENADLCFFLPNQIELLPKPQFNLFLTISSLHEMTLGQVKNYLSVINEYTHGYFYMSQTAKIVDIAGNSARFNYNDYPASWKPVFLRKHPIHTGFFEALYEIS